MSNTPENWIQKNRVLNVVSTVSSLFSVSVVIQKKKIFSFLGCQDKNDYGYIMYCNDVYSHTAAG